LVHPEGDKKLRVCCTLSFHIMKILALLLLLPSLVLAGLPTPEEEIATLKAEYARREAAAVRPVKDWLAGELAKREKVFLAAGKSEAAAAVARERAGMLLCSTAWSYEERGGVFKLIFDPDGTGTHSYSGSRFKWSVSGGTITLTLLSDGRKAVLLLDPLNLSYKGTDFNGKSPVSGKALLADTP
jgi:hypothetical protein